ncbi:MAG TPA: SIS domain-containing protein, partial [Anaerolineaceae bacterium]|nr:SIS domain-containing protein [Anaerolineaceae bacterium]
MSKLTNEYLKKVIDLLNKIETEEEDNIDKAATLMADAIENGNRLFGFGCTHSSLPIQGVVYRAGGLMLMNPIYAPGIAPLNVFPHTITPAIEKLTGDGQDLLGNPPI